MPEPWSVSTPVDLGVFPGSKTLKRVHYLKGLSRSR